MNHGSLFSGIGGFDLAAEWMGWTNKFHCEWNEFGQRVLKYYWPEAKSYEDITKTDFTIWRGKIDILTGGFPCQPYSVAGKRLGKEDDRHLWPEMLRAIREIQPRWVVGENVRGIVNWSKGLVFEEIQSDLEAEGYEVQPFLLPAVAVNAPHRRDRIWFVAYRSDTGIKGVQGQEDTTVSGVVTNSGGNGPQFTKESQEGCKSERCGVPLNESESLFGSGIIADTKSKRLKSQSIRSKKFQSQERQTLYGRSCNGEIPGWKHFPTQSPVCNRDDGFPGELVGLTFPKWRTESIKAMGNAIVPQIAYQIFKAIEKYEKLD